MALYQMGLTHWREGAEAMRDMQTAADTVSRWMDAASEVVDAAADAVRQAEPMGHPLHGDGFWVPADHWRPLMKQLDEMK